MAEREFRRNLAHSPDTVLSDVSKRIIARWGAAVKEYDVANPLTESEIQIMESNGQGNDDIARRYGATLIIGVVSEDFSFGVQIGDGALIAIDAEGKASTPIPEDEACFMNYTTSICASDAIEHFNWFFDGSGSIRWIMVATDGFTNSFQSKDSMLRHCINISKHLSNGRWKEVRANLDKRSRSDTADDTSLAAVYYTPKHR